MLVGRRDRDRFRKQLEERFSEAYRALDDQEKLDALSQIAHFMVGEGKAAIADTDLLPVLTEAIGRLPKSIATSPSAILKALKERSGVLRGASETTSEFAHNGFRSYLAARRFVETGACGDLLLKAEHTADPDLPVMAAAIGGGDYGERLIRELQGRISSLRSKAPRRLRIMALRCWQASGASPELQKEFLQPLEKGVLPPRTFEEAGQLAELGERIVSRLRRGKRMEPGTAAPSVRALRLIGGAEAGAALNAYLDHKSDQVVDELAQALNPLSIKKIATFVAAAELWVDCPPLRHLREPDLDLLPEDSRTLILKGAGLRNVDALRRFNDLTLLSLVDTQVWDVAPLATLTALQTLDLSGTQVSSVEPLKGLTALRTLYLSGTQVSSVEPLKGLTALRTLDLSGTPVSSLEPLKGLTALQTLDLSDTQVSSLEPLKGLTALQTARPLLHAGEQRRAAQGPHRPADARPLRHAGEQHRAAQGPHRPAVARPLRHAGEQHRAAQGPHRPAEARPLRHAGEQHRAARGPHRPAGARPLQHAGEQHRAAQGPHRPADGSTSPARR